MSNVCGVILWLLLKQQNTKLVGGNPRFSRVNTVVAIARLDVWIALTTTVAYSASLFVVLTYIAPILLDVTGIFSSFAVTAASLAVLAKQ